MATIDAFISYASEDAAWARRLERELSTLNVATFWDKPGLLAGDPWEHRLMVTLQQSRNLVVLWSGNARASDWVNREMREFDRIRFQGRTDTPDPGRRLIIVGLEDVNHSYASVQQVELPAEAYAGGPDALTAAAWREVGTRIQEAIQAHDPHVRVPLAIFAMTKAEYDVLDRDDHSPYGKSFDAVVKALEDEARAREVRWRRALRRLRRVPARPATGELVASCYGASRSDWRPFGSGTPITDVLRHILDQVNAGAGTPRYRWHPVDLLDVEPDEARRRIGEMFCHGPSLIIVDPLSLYVWNIAYRFSQLQKCGSNDHALVTVMAPVSTPRSLTVLREFTRNAAAPFIDPYYVPPVPHQPHPMFAVNVSDEFDALRLIRGSLGRYRPGTRGPDTPSHDFLRT